MKVRSGNSLTQEEFQQAVDLIKQKRPDIWKKMQDNEIEDTGQKDVFDDLIKLFNEANVLPGFDIKSRVLFDIRTLIRKELNLPI